MMLMKKRRWVRQNRKDKGKSQIKKPQQNKPKMINSLTRTPQPTNYEKDSKKKQQK